MTASIALGSVESHVPETAFGKWFLQINTWTVHVLDHALNDLERFQPQRSIAMDIEPAMLATAAQENGNLAGKPYA